VQPQQVAAMLLLLFAGKCGCDVAGGRWVVGGGWLAAQAVQIPL